jgi:aryl-alcohol dehydrogenase-like predicted oxidoreductase
MQTRPLGDTGLHVSPLALGAARGASADPEGFRSTARAAFGSGINLVDTAAGYEDGACEEELGRVLADFPDVRVCTKYRPYADWYPDSPYNGSAEALEASVEASLRRLKRERIDILLGHGMRTRASLRQFLENGSYEAMVRLREAGKVGHIGISELSEGDGEHAVLQDALATDAFEVIMLTLNILLQTAAETVLPRAVEQGIGTLVMMPLDQAGRNRGLVSREAALASVRRLVKRGLLPDEAPYTDPQLLDFLGERPMPETALRFILEHPVGSICVGMSRPARVADNLRALENAPPFLDPEDLERLRALFGRVRAQTLYTPES